MITFSHTRTKVFAGITAFTILATAAAVIYIRYDLNRFKRELAELNTKPGVSPLSQQDESEEDISFADFMEAISSDDFVATVGQALESGADTDYADDDPEVAELKRECAEIIASINDELLPKFYALQAEAESILAQYPRDYAAEIAAIDARVQADPAARYFHKRMADGATIEEAQADPEYQRLLRETDPWLALGGKPE